MSSDDSEISYYISIWSVHPSYERIFILRGHRLCVTSICFSANSLQLASGSADATVKIWSLETGRKLRTLAHGSDIRKVEFNMAGDRLLSLTEVGVYIWSLESSELSSVLPVGYKFSVALFNPLNDNELLAVGKNTIVVWNICEGQENMITEIIPPKVLCMAASPAGSKVAYFYDRAKGAIFDFQLDSSVDIGVGDGNDACFDGIGGRLAVTEAFNIIILDTITAQPLFVIDCSIGSPVQEDVTNIGWAANSNFVLATMWNRWILIDSETGNILHAQDGEFCFCVVRAVFQHVVLM